MYKNSHGITTIKLSDFQLEKRHLPLLIEEGRPPMLYKDYAALCKKLWAYFKHADEETVEAAFADLNESVGKTCNLPDFEEFCTLFENRA